MRFRPLAPVLVLAGGLSSFAQPSPLPSPQPAPIETDLLKIPDGFREFAARATLGGDSYASKTERLARLAMSKSEAGGLGITYANDRTRTVEEVWRDRKANCLSLTAFYVAACKALDIPVIFADAPTMNFWVRRGDIILNERHVVAAIRVNPVTTLVADFSGHAQSGPFPIVPMTESRFRALFHSNRAAEILLDGDPNGAAREAEAAVQEDPGSAVAWNTYGVVEQALGHPAAAEKALRRALAEDPKNGAACGNLEDLFWREGQAEEASKYRQMGLKVRDRDPYFHAFLAKEALAAGRNGDAKDQIRRAIRLQGMEPDFYLLLAQVEVNQGERAAAAKAVHKAMHWSLPEQRKRMESKLALIENPT